MDALSRYRILHRAVCAEVAKFWKTGRRPTSFRSARVAIAETLEPRQLLTATASLCGPGSVYEGSSYNLNLNASSTEGPTHLGNWTISWGDGHSDTASSGACSVSHVYSSPSSGYCVYAEIADGDGSSYSSIPVDVNEVTPWLGISGGWTSTGSSTAPADGPEGSTYFLSTAFLDYVGPGADHVATWDVYWGDGSCNSINASSSPAVSDADTFTHVYGNASHYDISAVAHTRDGTYTIGTSVTVDYVTPSTWESGVENTSSGSSYALGTFFYDPPGHIANKWIVDWGDGSSNTCNISGDSHAFNHSYASDGEYSITEFVFDAENPYSATHPEALVAGYNATTEVFVGNPLNVEYASAVPNGSSVYPYAFYTDVADNAPSSWEVDWGDGTSDTTTAVDVASVNTYEANFSHVYAEVGCYTGTLTVNDADGTYSEQVNVEVDYSQPLPTLAGPTSVNREESYILYDTFSDVPGRSADGWVVEWGDGTSDYYPCDPGSFSHIYSEAGSYNVDATVYDSACAVSDASESVTVNEVPVSGAWMCGAESISENTEFDLYGGVSDPLGLPTSDWSWNVDWGDGTSNAYTDSADGFSHFYYTPGDYSVTLTATETDRTASATRDMTVNDVAPDLTGGGTTFAYLGAGTIVVDGSFTDPGGSAPTAWEFDWGDGTSSTNAGVESATGSEGNSGWGDTEFDHVYSVANGYTGILTVSDADGSYSTTVPIEVDPSPVSIDGATNVGEHADYSINVSADAGTPDDWTVDWGDGAVDNFTTGGTPCTFDHTYTHTGNYTITASADIGGYSASSTAGIEVDEGSPWLWASGPASETIGCDAVLYAGFCYADGTGAASWNVDWGDGSSNWYTDAGAGCANSFDHVYTEVGSYSAELTAYDGEGYSFDTSVAMNINDIPPAVTGLSATAEDTQALLSWNSSALATSYNIYQYNGSVYVNIGSTADTNYTVTGLSNGTSYGYKVSAASDGGEGDLSSAVSVTPAVSDVEFLTAAAASTTEIDLSWNLTTIGAQSIEVDRSTDGSTWSAVTTTLAGTALTYADTGLAENTQYFYQVRAIFPDTTTSDFSVPATAFTLPAVTGLTAAVPTVTSGPAPAASEIDLSWSLNITTATDMVVQISTDGTTFTTLTSTLDPATTTYNVTGLDENTHYYFRVHAITTGGTSEEVAATDASTSAAVDGLSASAASTSEIDLAWNLNVTDASDIQIDQSTDGGTTWTTLTSTLDPTNLTYADTGLADNTDYTYRIRAIRTGGDSAFTDPTDATTTADISDLTATTISTGEVDLAWTLNATGITLLSIYRATDGGGYSFLTDSDLSMILTNSSTTYADTSATEGHDYSYKLQATFSGGLGAMSDPADASTAPIQNLDYTPATTSQVLTWDNFSTSGTAIEVDGSTNGTTFSALTTSLSGSAITYTQSSLTANTEYWYKVKITDSAGTTTTDVLDTWTLPLAPTSLGSSSVTPTNVHLTWTNPGSSSTPFLIERSDDGGSTFSDVGVTLPGATAFDDNTIDDGTSYEYIAGALSNDQLNFNPAATPTTVSPALAAPNELFVGTFHNNQADLSWNEPSQTATGYTIERSTDDTTFSTLATVDGGENEFADTTVTAGTVYYYRVFATNDSATSGDSNGAIVAVPPNISISADSSVDQGATFTLNTSVTYATGQIDPVKGWTIDWGDGSTTNASGTANGDPGSFTHTYSTNGSFVVTASTIDGSYSGTLAVMVNYVGGALSVTDNASGSPSSIAAGASYQLTPSFTDGGGLHVTQWQVDWGDGTIDTMTNSSPGSGTDTNTFSHTYSTPWSYYSVTVAAVADDGVVEFNKHLTVTGTGPWVGDSIGIDSVFGSEGVDNAAVTFADFTSGSSAVNYTINWGDGSSNSTVSVIPGDESPATHHTYPHQGNYLVTVSGNGDVGYQMAIIGQTAPTISTPGTQTVASGSSLVVTTSFADINSDPNAVAYVNWGNGSGYQVATVSGTTITADLTTAPPPGVYSATIIVYPLGSNSSSFDGNATDFVSTAVFFVDTTGAPTGTVKEVDFGASNMADFHPVTDDKSATSYTTAQWLNGVSEPICYTRSGTTNDSGGNALLTATVTMNVTGMPGGSPEVKATVNGVDTTPVDPSLSANGLTLTAQVTSNGALPSTIDKLNETIVWYISNDGGATWVNAGSTVNTAYIVNGTAPKGSQLIETVLNVGCVNATGNVPTGDGSNVANQIFDNSFAQRQVARIHPTQLMQYWGKLSSGVGPPNNTMSQLTSTLIEQEDGRCGAWARFFVDVLRAQGINAYVYKIVPNPDIANTNYKDALEFHWPILGLVVHTVVAQGGDASTDFFSDHAVVELNKNLNHSGNTVYDPSYGTRSTSELEWMDKSLTGIMFQKGNKPKTEVHMKGVKDMDFTEFGY